MTKEVFHVTTQRKARNYRNTGHINKPVRGFDTLLGATIRAMKTGRKVVLKITTDHETHKLPDHHNKYGVAYWIDGDIKCSNYTCVVSPGKS